VGLTVSLTVTVTVGLTVTVTAGLTVTLTVGLTVTWAVVVRRFNPIRIELFGSLCPFYRYGESVREALANPAWACPVCRGICRLQLLPPAQGVAPHGDPPTERYLPSLPLYCMPLHCMPLYCMPLYCMPLYIAVCHCTLLYATVLYATVL